MFDVLVNKIESNTEETHGLETYLDGNLDTSNPHNLVVLHFCDALVIAMQKEAMLDMPKIVIKRESLFEEIPTTISIPFFTEVLTSEEKHFLYFNADIFYFRFGLWMNDSVLPLRIENKNIVGLEQSEYFANDFKFRVHQNGKFSALK